MINLRLPPSSALSCIEINVIHSENTSISIYDINGRKVMDLYKGTPNIGMKRLFFNAKELQKGVYFVRVQTQNGTSVHRFVAMP
ncbi:T9SS type A sorting domain-containing protein [bacterium]|nr:T9SS type A sorting domain-containing protein [bacterium]